MYVERRTYGPNSGGLTQAEFKLELLQMKKGAEAPLYIFNF
jgi:hypothetical protein